MIIRHSSQVTNIMVNRSKRALKQIIVIVILESCIPIIHLWHSTSNRS